MSNPAELQTIPNQELGALLFGQQHILSQFFFVTRHGQCHTVELSDLPHYELLQNARDEGDLDQDYYRYLKCSWDYYCGGDLNTSERRRRRIDRFLQLQLEVSKRAHLREKAITAPITVCRRPDGRTIVVDGNHRAAIALNLGLDVRARQISLATQAAQIVAVPDEFYGSGRLNLPYQSIYHHRHELVAGRRPDMLERIDRLAEADLRDRTVLELGCNLGGNCFLAAERGAAAVTGIEVSPAIASAAVRLNTLFAHPCFFAVWDLNDPLEGFPSFDTVLCFSVVNHLQDKKGIVETLRRTVGRVLYFEGHAGTSRNDYEYLLNSDNFSEIELIGYGRNSVDSTRSTRPLFRCEVHPPAGPVAGREPSGLRTISSLFSEGASAWQATTTAMRAGQRSRAHGFDPEFAATKTDVQAAIPHGCRFILVDGEQFRGTLPNADLAFPFLERDGQFWGPPADDGVAIREFDRLRLAGAQFIAFAWSAFWWLEFYTTFARHLHENFPRIWKTERLVVFDLRPPRH